MGDIFRKIAALPVALKVMLAIAALIVLGLAVILSSLLVKVAFGALVIASLMYLVHLRQSRSPRRWGIAMVMSLVLVLVFSSISSALYGGRGHPERATSPEPTQEQRELAPTEKTEREAPEPTAEETREEPEQPVAAATEGSKSAGRADSASYSLSCCILEASSRGCNA